MIEKKKARERKRVCERERERDRDRMRMREGVDNMNTSLYVTGESERKVIICKYSYIFDGKQRKTDD